MLLFRPDETRSTRQLIFELRNGPGLPQFNLDKVDGEWRPVETSDRLVNQSHGEKLDAERRRKQDIILQLIFEEAAQGRVYTANQFAEGFEGQAGLGANRTINERLAVLATKGYLKFFRDTDHYNLPPLVRSKYGYLCVEQMTIPGSSAINHDTGELISTQIPVLPTHYKCPQTGAALPVENPNIWIYQEDNL